MPQFCCRSDPHTADIFAYDKKPLSQGLSADKKKVSVIFYAFIRVVSLSSAAGTISSGSADAARPEASSAGAAEAQKEWLNSTSEEIKIMNDVLRDMLTLAQGEALSGITKVNADVSKIADGICLQFDAVAFEKNITLESRIQENVFADCDEKMIRRLFTILIDNAVKYEPEGGKVFVALQKNGNKTTFAVRNFGSTVKKEDLPHLFERFYRADKSRSGGGVGLGLAIAKNIADLHGGTIKAASSETTGTLFIAEF